MDISIEKTVSYDISKIRISCIIITKEANDKLFIVAPYTWIDATNKVIRSGTQIYNEAILLKELGQFVFPALKAVITALTTKDGINQNLIFNFGTEITGSTGNLNDKTWVVTPITNAQIVAALTANGLNVDSFNAILVGMGQAIFA